MTNGNSVGPFPRKDRPYELLHKPDWEEAKERYRAWWNREYFGRCGLWVTAPRDDAPADPEPSEPADPEEKWADLDYLFASCEYSMRRTFFISIPADQVREALEDLSARGLLIMTSCRTEAEARDLLRNAEKWSGETR